MRVRIVVVICAGEFKCRIHAYVGRRGDCGVIFLVHVIFASQTIAKRNNLGILALSFISPRTAGDISVEFCRHGHFRVNL